jgi:hypothetical protein
MMIQMPVIDVFMRIHVMDFELLGIKSFMRLPFCGSTGLGPSLNGSFHVKFVSLPSMLHAH